ncbi:hypothetical protein ACIBCT_37440 [Streptosporangium sp. NPDC050855]|uniref:hypothetical protein n=1 Tax=Streptosporangium sp. NPDC050855 TaxID=3366194 RepID=UPI0037A08422
MKNNEPTTAQIRLFPVTEDAQLRIGGQVGKGKTSADTLIQAALTSTRATPQQTPKP